MAAAAAFSSSSFQLSFLGPPRKSSSTSSPLIGYNRTGVRRFGGCHPPPPRSSSSEGGSTVTVVDKTLQSIKNSGVIACLRAQSAEVAIEAAEAALSGGISVLEIVVSTPGVFEVLHQLVQDYPASTIGAGTVLNAKDARNAVNAGAKFLMSPAIVKFLFKYREWLVAYNTPRSRNSLSSPLKMLSNLQEILDDVQGSDYLYIPGAMTPTEILSAYNAGAKIVKVYPVSALGGIHYIASLKKPFSHIPMVASQGITIDLIGEYIAQGASSVVLSDAIFDKEAMAQRNFGAVSQLAQFAALAGTKATKRKKRSSVV